MQHLVCKKSGTTGGGRLSFNKTPKGPNGKHLAGGVFQPSCRPGKERPGWGGENKKDKGRGGQPLRATWKRPSLVSKENDGLKPVQPRPEVQKRRNDPTPPPFGPEPTRNGKVRREGHGAAMPKGETQSEVKKKKRGGERKPNGLGCSGGIVERKAGIRGRPGNPWGAPKVGRPRGVRSEAGKLVVGQKKVKGKPVPAQGRPSGPKKKKQPEPTGR